MPLNIRLAAGIYHRGRHIIYISNYLHIYIYMFVKILCTYVSRISCVYMFIDYILYNSYYMYIYILQIGPEVSAGMQGCGDEH